MSLRWGGRRICCIEVVDFRLKVKRSEKNEDSCFFGRKSLEVGKIINNFA